MNCMDKKSLFGTSGIRGDAEKLFTDQFSFDLGRTFAIFLTKNNQDGAIATGMDPRGSSPRIKTAFETGLVYEERVIYDQGATPVPSMCYVLKISDYLVGSAMITGSHIKDYLNGIKFFAFDEEITKDHEREIETIYQEIKERVSYRKKILDIETEGKAKEEYSEMLVKLGKGSYPNWKVVVDPGDGAQSDIMPQVLKRLGVNVVELNATLQGKFFARDTENQEDFAGLMDKVPQEKADFGIGFDSDGDRCIFVDRRGTFIPGDYTASLVAREAKGSCIVTPIATSQVVEHLGKKVIRTQVGSPKVIEKMKKFEASFGFEANGGGISSEIMFTRDGGSTTIKFLNILAASKKSIEELVAELPKFYLFKTKVDYKWELKEKILLKAKGRFKGIKVEELDGLKIWMDENTWMLFRSSANAPEFRVFAESKDKNKARQLMQEGIEFVKGMI